MTKPVPTAYLHTGKRFSIEYRRLESRFVNHWTATVSVNLARSEITFQLDAAPWVELQTEIRKLGLELHENGAELAGAKMEEP